MYLMVTLTLSVLPLPQIALGGRAQRKQRQAEETLRPYFGRVEPVSKSECTEEELGQFPFRLLDWFLLLNRMGKSYVPAALPQSCLSYAQRTQLAQERFSLLDKNKDGKLSRRDLKKLQYKRMPMEHCAEPFFKSCDRNKNRKVTLKEWTNCLVDRSEDWFYHFMSVKMGSPKLCIKGRQEKQP
ncbi:SPARC-like protein 1 [Oryzias melastigma]|uniref:SPARC-like protein 1 n=1 Tax=Oryzias melastigma TaxID=30732 RepID=A0A834FL94_ORYME|nr:SPARC-like protein 1 [Oryzias melastigma]